MPPRDVWQSRRCRNPAPLSVSWGHAKLISSLQPEKTERQKGTLVTCCKTLVGPASSNNFTCVTRLKHWPRDACTRRDQDIPVCQNSPSSAFTSHQLYTTHLLLTLLEVLKNRTARGRGTNSIMPTTPWSIGLFNQGRKPLDRSSRKKHANSQ